MKAAYLGTTQALGKVEEALGADGQDGSSVLEKS